MTVPLNQAVIKAIGKIPTDAWTGIKYPKRSTMTTPVGGSPLNVQIKLALDTGIRLSEGMALQINDFDPVHATIQIREAKNHQHRLLPVVKGFLRKAKRDVSAEESSGSSQ